MSEARPRLLYFNGPWDYLGARIRRSYAEPLGRLLAQDFEVVSVSGSCDFAREVERHQPDAVLFHSGIGAHSEPEITIRNVDAFPELPRMGYVLRDPFSSLRTAAINRLRAWRVHQVFTPFRVSDSPAPVFRDSIYVPWWIDDSVFHDYGEEKSIPISLTGGGWFPRSAFYPWRFAVAAKLLPRFSVLHLPVQLPHLAGHAFVGGEYARALNRSLISGGCGSINRFLTLKPLEIPAARCCLLTEETEVMKAVGFRDGVNCVFADEHTVAEKVQALLDDPARLRAITDAGHRLVHERHTQRHRRMFIEWYRLWRIRGAGQRVAQSDPFGPLQLIDAAAPTPPVQFPTENPFIAGVEAGYGALAAGRNAEALGHFQSALDAFPYMAEARLGAAICHLREGRHQSAFDDLGHFQNFEWQHCEVPRHPDVLVLAHLALLLLFRAPEAGLGLLEKFSHLRHPALNALRWVIANRRGEFGKRAARLVASDQDDSRNIEAVHLLPEQDFCGWVKTWTGYLDARPSLAAAV